MNTSSHPGARRIPAALRPWWLRAPSSANPLLPRKTASERFALAIAAIILVGFLVAAIAAMGQVKNVADDAAPATPRGQDVSAVVTSNTSAGANGLMAQTLSWSSNGRQHTERQYSYDDSPRGTRMKIQVDGDGDRIHGHLMDLDAPTLVGLLTFAVVGAFLWLLTLTLRALKWWLMRCRMRVWATEWEHLDRICGDRR
jgi:uncharacterized integral membrane protein